MSIVKSIGFGTLTLMLSSMAAGSNPQSFVYQGRITDTAGQMTTGNVGLRFQVWSPNKDCLLYEETQTVDLTNSDGYFSVAIGSSVGSTKRTANDPNFPMSKVFSNPLAQLRAPGTNCSSGYTPTSGDLRYLRVIVSQNSTVDTLSPDQVLASTPFATTAETLQGKLPGDFVQIKDNGTTVLNQSNLEQVFEAGAFSRLLSLLNNTSAKDMANQRITSVATPTSGSDATNKDYVDRQIAGMSVDPNFQTNLTPGNVLSYNGTGWTSTALPAHATATPTACSAGQASRWDGTAWSCIAASGGGGGGSGGAATMTGNNTEIVLTAGSEKVQMVDISTAGVIRLPDATSFASTGGPIFQLLNAQAIAIPVVDALGKLVGQVPAGGATDIFLFDRSTTDGKWLSSAATGYSTSFTQKIETVGLGANLIPASYSRQFAHVSDNLGLYVYLFSSNGSAPYEVRTAVLTINPSTKVTTLGTQITLLSGLTSTPSFNIIALSPTKAVIDINDYGTSTRQLQGVGISGSTVSLMGSPVSVSTNCLTGQILKSDTGVYCQNNFDIHKYDFSGSSLAYSGSVTIPGGYVYWLMQFGAQEAIGYCDSSVLKVATANYVNGGASAGAPLTADPSGCTSPASVSGSKPYLRIDTNNLWILNGGNPVRRIKISFDGTNLAANTPVQIPVDFGYGAGLLTTGGQTYVTAGSGTSKRVKVTNVSTFGISAPEKTSECYGIRSDVGHCAIFDIDGSNLKVQHQIGF